MPRFVKPKTALYKLHGSLAALVKESTWHKMLNGDPVGVWESDFNYWTLTMNGTVVETITIRYTPGERLENNKTKAVERFAKISPLFGKECAAAFAKPTGDVVEKFTEKWRVVNGYPNVLHLSPENIARHRRENMDALKLANRMRVLIKDQVTMDAITDELKFGITREGKD